MSRKLIVLCLTLVMMFSIAVSANASNEKAISITEEAKVIEALKELENNPLLKKAQETAKNMVMNGKLDELYEAEEVKWLLKKFEKNPLLEQKYLESLDAFNPEKVGEKLDGISLSNNEIKLIEFDDGSFIVVALETNRKADNEPDMMSIQSTTYHEELSGYGSWETKYWVYAFPAPNRYQLNTLYTHYTTYFNIYSTNTTGTSSVYPTLITDRTSYVEVNDSSSVRSRGEFEVTTYAGGIPISTKEYALVLNIQKISGPDFTVTGTFHTN